MNFYKSWFIANRLDSTANGYICLDTLEILTSKYIRVMFKSDDDRYIRKFNVPIKSCSLVLGNGLIEMPIEVFVQRCVNISYHDNSISFKLDVNFNHEALSFNYTMSNNKLLVTFGNSDDDNTSFLIYEKDDSLWLNDKEMASCFYFGKLTGFCNSSVLGVGLSGYDFSFDYALVKVHLDGTVEVFDNIRQLQCADKLVPVQDCLARGLMI